VDRFFDELQELEAASVVEDFDRDGVNCPLYSGWRLGKLNPGVIRDWEGLVEAAGKSVEGWGVPLCRGVGVVSGKADSTSVVDLRDEACGEETFRFGEGSNGYVRKGGGHPLGKGVGSGVGSGSEKTS